MEAPAKAKVTTRVYSYASAPSTPRSSRTVSRPGSPTKSKAESSLQPLVRPKAKVNSSATILRKSPSTTSCNINPKPRTARVNPRSKNLKSQPLLSSPRQDEPLPPNPRTVLSSRPVFQISSGTTSPTPSTSSSPSWLQPTTPTRSETLPPSSHKKQYGSISLTNAVPRASRSRSSSLTSSELASVLDTDGDVSPLRVKVKAKVSSLAKKIEASSSSSTLNPPPYATIGRSFTPHSRAPSISRPPPTRPSPPPSPPSPFIFYPITTATPAANPHRFALGRLPAQNTSPQGAPLGNTRLNGSVPSPIQTRISADLTKPEPEITVSAHSPPSSILSFSSRSSMSLPGDSPTTGLTQIHSVETEQKFARTTDNLLGVTEMIAVNGVAEQDVHSPTDSKDVTEDLSNSRTIMAEAKSNRKMADLEITNRSLLTINSSLEGTKHRQAKEIRDLRRKLRESRLVLPPRAYRAVSQHDEVVDDDEDDDDKEAMELAVEGQDGDETYRRVKVMLETLLERGKQALQTVPADFVGNSKGSAKVLSAEEVRDWASGEKGTDIDTRDSATPPSPVIPDDESLSSGDVEALADSQSVVLSPIHVTNIA